MFRSYCIPLWLVAAIVVFRLSFGLETVAVLHDGHDTAADDHATEPKSVAFSKEHPVSWDPAATPVQQEKRNSPKVTSVRQPTIVAALAYPLAGNASVQARNSTAVADQDGFATRLPVSLVTVLTVVMAGSSGLGAVPFFFVGSLSPYWSGMANAVACGFMLAASFDLLHEGEPYGGELVTVGVLLGALFIRTSHQFLEKYEDVEFEQLKGAGARKTLLVVGVMAAHALGEGCGVGVSFCGSRGWAQGILVTIAIGVHNIPEGLAKATVLVAQGVSAKQALWWSMLTCAPQPLVAVPSFLFVDTFKAVLPIALGFACGCMVWMVVSELMPDALKDAPAEQVATATTLSAACLEAVRMALATLEQPNGTLASPVRADLRMLLPAAAALLLSLIPATAAGAMLSMVSASAPVLLGVSCGTVWALGISGVLQHIIMPSGLALHITLLLVAVGTLCLRGLWQAHSSKYSNSNSRLGSCDAEQGTASNQRKAVVFDAVVVQHNDYERSSCHARHMLDGRRPMVLPDSPKDVLHGSTSVPSGASVHQSMAASCALLVLVLHGIPEGWLIAKNVIITNPDHVAILLPAFLTTLVKGLAAAALFALIFANRRHSCGGCGWLVLNMVGVAMLGGLGPLSAIWSLMRFPFGVVHDTSGYDSRMVSEKCHVMMSGALFAVGCWVLRPQMQTRPARGGGLSFVAGVVLVGVVTAVQLLLRFLQQQS